jgi:OOP family OmpA-OmpF porin
MKTKPLLFAVTLAQAVSSSPAFAQGLYAEIGAGRSHARADCAGTSQCDRNGAFVRGILGYEFTPNWALEVTLADLGRIQATATVPGVGSVQASARMRSFGIGAAGTWPLSEAFSMTGRLGIASNKTSVGGSAVGVSVSDSERKTVPYAGIALNCALSKTTSVGLSVDRTEAGYAGEKLAVLALGLGARFRF